MGLGDGALDSYVLRTYRYSMLGTAGRRPSINFWMGELGWAEMQRGSMAHRLGLWSLVLDAWASRPKTNRRDEEGGREGIGTIDGGRRGSSL